MPLDFDQWSSATPLIAGYPAWVSGQDATRIAAYSLYEQMYWNVPEAYKLIQRGEDTKPIYVPAAKQIVETMHRYLAPGISIVPDPELGTSGEQAAAALIWKSFGRRERFASLFNNNKRFMLIRGDMVFHILADSAREEGSRISIEAVDPASYFPIWSEDELGRDVIIGVHLVEQVTLDDGTVAINRLTYRKTTETGGPSPITVEEATFESDKWGGPNGMDEKAIAQIRPATPLPPEITQIPVYHVHNFAGPTEPWGSSELRGMERLLAAVNQSISDEELEIVLNGLGVYVTDAGTPIDATTGEPTAWRLGPAKVVQLPNGKTFKRVSSELNVAPHQEHLKYLHDQIDQTVGNSDVAKGRVDVEVAESGIAQLLQMAPKFAMAEEKELEITDVLINMLFDLKMWFAAYESINLGEAQWIPKYGDRLPVNRASRFKEIVELVAAKLVSAQWARGELKKIGYEFPDDTTMMSQILEETEMIATVEQDALGSRIDREVAEEDEEEQV